MKHRRRFHPGKNRNGGGGGNNGNAMPAGGFPDDLALG